MDVQDNIIMKNKVQNKKRYETMVFDYKTTALTDFRFGHIHPNVVTKYKEKEPPVKHRKEPLRVTQTLTDWKDGNKVRFDLFLKPKEIVQTNPRTIQESQILAEDSEREQVRKTRPRLVLTPAAAIDDAPERERTLILKDMYLSATQKAMHDGIASLAANKPVKAPLVPVPAPAVPIRMVKKYKPRVVPPEWRMDSASWDGRQLRAHCDPSREFWLRPRETQPKGRNFI